MLNQWLLSRNYRTTIKAMVEAKIAGGEDYSFAKLATGTRIQRTFLSQVTNLKQHLSNDQLFAIAKALKINAEVYDHLVLLSEWERCKFPARKAHLELKLKSLEKHLEGPMPSGGIAGIQPDAWDDYFCDPMAEAVFRFLSIARYRNEPGLIRDRLGLSSKRWQEICKTLLACELIEDRQGLYFPIKPGFYAQEQSPEEKIRHILARLKVTEQKLKQRNIDDFLYNWWIMCSPQNKKQLKIEYLNLIERIYRESLLVPAEDVYQLSVDLLTP